jgi:hypothetical protein
MARPKGLAKTGGRTVGTPNKVDRLRTMILKALDGVGGQAYLQRQAELNPGPFLSLVSKCIPREVHQEITAEMTIRAEVRRELVENVVTLLRHDAGGESEAPERARLASQRRGVTIEHDGRSRGEVAAEEPVNGPVGSVAGSDALIQRAASPAERAMQATQGAAKVSPGAVANPAS